MNLRRENEGGREGGRGGRGKGGREEEVKQNYNPARQVSDSCRLAGQ